MSDPEDNIGETSIRPRILYASIFVYVSLTGGRFLSVLLQDAGLSDSQIGLCFASSTVVQSLCSSFSGSFADDYERRHPGLGRSRVLLCGILMSGALFLLQGLHHVTTIPVVSTVTWHVVLRVLYAASTSFVWPVLDGITLDYLNEHSDKADFGKERLHGAIWWAITNLIMGPSLDRLGFSILYLYSIVSLVAVAATIHIFTNAQLASRQGQRRRQDTGNQLGHDTKENIDVDTSAKDSVENQGNRELPLPKGLKRQKSHVVPTDEEDNEVKEEEEAPDKPRLSLVSIGSMICGTTTGAAFMFAVFCLAIGMAVVEQLIFLYFEVLGSSYTLCSLTVLLTVLCEIGLFAYGPELLNRWGPIKLLLLAGVCYVLRVIGYSLVPQGQPWFVLLFEPLHGITYACASISSVDFVAQLMPSGYESSGQGLLHTLRGFGSVLGVLFGGIGDDWLGPRTVYRCLAAVVTVGLSVLAVTSSLNDTRGGRYAMGAVTEEDETVNTIQSCASLELVVIEEKDIG
ncbi:expressed unknown protein [Seminavis robusta]|uniref:Major facilitator superfamily associated domain-containing protein n=1 Tax=Seminavis robusta TaxID=568900 RepID=A0A9N8DBR8_9STRA|nr:expressed unknown protein [Seminavis robusta]|eukprot:Sro26_g017640.1 n/a (515) ;mRNA; r:78625-80169